mmetsp:Transcript_124732/g.338822  ORF Transcript_124732/g.338822 Transcript_124732/m.338822 type:complete len:250 (+) Transcript_124732:309-1058(+)
MPWGRPGAERPPSQPRAGRRGHLQAQGRAPGGAPRGQPQAGKARPLDEQHRCFELAQAGGGPGGQRRADRTRPDLQQPGRRGRGGAREGDHEEQGADVAVPTGQPHRGGRRPAAANSTGGVQQHQVLGPPPEPHSGQAGRGHRRAGRKRGRPCLRPGGPECWCGPSTECSAARPCEGRRSSSTPRRQLASNAGGSARRGEEAEPQRAAPRGCEAAAARRVPPGWRPRCPPGTVSPRRMDRLPGPRLSGP